MLLKAGVFISTRFNSQWKQLGLCYKVFPSKLSLILQNEEEKRSTIRCGIILPYKDRDKASFLSALLADVYTADQTWFQTLINRYDRKDTMKVLVKYAEHFDLRSDHNSTMLAIPSPFLKEHKIEFLEFHQGNSDSTTIELDHGCHLYIDLSGSITPPWPIIRIQDTKSTGNLHMANSVDSKLALKSILEFIRDKSSVKQYLANLERSNLENVSMELGKIFDNKKLIFEDLKRSVLDNIERTESLRPRKDQLQLEKKKMLKEIELWSKLAHTELLTVIKPLLDNFVREQLSVWKIYTYSESELRLKLVELLVKPLNNLQMKNSLYKLCGSLRIDDSFTLSSPLEIQNIDEKVVKVHRHVNKTIYGNFFTLQLPLLICSSIGFISEQFSAYSMGALASLGIVLGLKRVMSDWENTMKDTSKMIIDSIRENIELDSVFLRKYCQKYFEMEEAKLNKKLELVEALSKELK